MATVDELVSEVKNMKAVTYDESLYGTNSVDAAPNLPVLNSYENYAKAYESNKRLEELNTSPEVPVEENQIFDPVLSTVKNQEEYDAFKNSDAYANTVLGKASANIQNAYLRYMGTDEAKLLEAQKISRATGISSKLILTNNDTFAGAQDAYNFLERNKAFKIKNADGTETDLSLARLEQAFPEISKLAEMDPDKAAIALANMKNVKEVHGIINSFRESWNVTDASNLKGKIGMRQWRNAERKGDTEELARLENIINNAKAVPSFFDEPGSAMAGGLANVMNQFVSGAIRGNERGVQGAAVGAMYGAATGSIVPGAGNFAGAAAGAKTGYIWGFKEGMVEDMAENIIGNNYLEFKGYKDQYGKPLLSDEEARVYALVAGGLETGIEFWHMPQFLKLLGGSGKGNAAGELAKIVSSYKDGKSVKAALFAWLKGNVTELAKSAHGESTEEFVQEVSNSLIKNIIASAHPGGDVKALSPYDILMNGSEAYGAALPGSLAAAIGGSMASNIPSVRTGARTFLEAKQIGWDAVEITLKEYNARKMLNDLRENLKTNEWFKKDPQGVNEVIKTQLEDVGLTDVHIDTEMLLSQEGGAELVEKLGKQAGLTDEQIQEKIDEKEELTIPTQVFCQNDITDEESKKLKEYITFDPNSQSVARIQQYSRLVKQGMDNVLKLEDTQYSEAVENIIADNFKDVEQIQAAEFILVAYPDNPVAGIEDEIKRLEVERNEMLRKAYETIAAGKGQGVQKINEEDRKGRYSNNDFWYTKWYDDHKRSMTKEDEYELAYNAVTGNDKYGLLGPREASEEADRWYNSQKAVLDDIERGISTFKQIKDKVAEIKKSGELQDIRGLSKEGYQVYSIVAKDILTNALNPEMKKAAVLDAILLARHCDRVAEIMRLAGKKDFTAMDAFKKIDMKYGGTFDPVTRKVYRQATLGEALKNWVTSDELIDIDNGETLFNIMPEDVQQEYIQAGEKLVQAKHENDDKFDSGEKVDALTYVCKAPPIFKALGYNATDVYISSVKLHDATKPLGSKTLKWDPHDVSDDILKVLPSKLCDPLIVMDSDSEKNKVIFILDIDKEDEKTKRPGKLYLPFALDMIPSGEGRKLGVRIQLLDSMYSKAIANIQDKISKAVTEKKEKIYYIANIKSDALGYLTHGLHLPTGDVNTSIALRNSIAQQFGKSSGNILKQEDVASPEVLRKQMEDIYNIALKDGTLGIAPNGKKSNLPLDMWLAVRTPAFIERYGDWRILAEGRFMSYDKPYEDIKDIVKDYRKLSIVNEETGIELRLGKSGAGKIISEVAKRLSAENGFNYKEHFAVVEHLPQLLKNATLSETAPDKNGELKSMKLFSAYFEVGENHKPGVAVFTVKENTINGHTVYTVQLVEIKNNPGGTLPIDVNKRSSASPGLSTVNISHLADKINKISVELDENNEPILNDSNISQENIFKQEDAQDKNLVAYHNITEQDLLRALDFGGFPVPSIAVMKNDIPYDKYGGITLVGKPDLADPQKGVPVYAKDGYTITFPRPTYAAPKLALVRKFKEKWKEFFYGVDDSYSIDSVYDTYKNPDNMVRELRDSFGFEYYYLTKVLGKKIEIPVNEYVPRLTVLKDEKTFNRLYELVENVDKYDDLEIWLKDIASVVEEYYDERIAGVSLKGIKANLERKKAQAVADGKVENNLLNAIFKELESYKKAKENPGNDYRQLKFDVRTNYSDIIYSKEYYQWVDKQIEELVGEGKVKIGNKFYPFTLENVTRYMVKHAGAAAESSLTFSAGKVAALTAQKFKSVAEMHKAEGKLGTEQQFNESANKAKELGDQYREAVSRYQKYKSEGIFQAFDDAMEALTKASDSKGYTTKAKLKAALVKSGGFEENIPDEVLQLGVDYLKALTDTTTQYFEAKPQRSVYIEDFAGAVVPEGTDPTLVQKLRDAGLQVEEYKAGDKDARFEATQKVGQQQQVFFQAAGVKSLTADKQLQVLAQNMYYAGATEEEILKKTGWHLGRDGKWRYEIPDNLNKIAYNKLRSLAKGDISSLTLGELYDNEKLYAAYPDIVEYKIEIIPDNDKTANGYVERGKKVIHIRLGDRNSNSIGMTLVHEVQHIIQRKEGFATGGSASTVEQQIVDQYKNDVRYLNSLTGQARKYYEINTTLNTYSELLMTSVYEGEYGIDYKDLNARYEKLQEEFDNLKVDEETKDKIDLAQERIKINGPRLGAIRNDDTYNWITNEPGVESKKAYRDLYGEQEARSTAAKAERYTELAEKEEADRVLADAKKALDNAYKELSPEQKALADKYSQEASMEIEDELIADEAGQAWLDAKDEYDTEAENNAEITEGVQNSQSKIDREILGYSSDSIVVFGDSVVDSYDMQNSGSTTRGIYYQTAVGKHIIHLFNTANESTFAHEMGHYFLQELKELAEMEGAPAQVKRDWETVKKWLNYQEGQTALTKEQQEKWARGWERYLRNGVAPATSLQRVFAYFKKWLTNIYRDVTMLGEEPSPAVKRVMDRMIATEQEIEYARARADYQSFERAGGMAYMPSASVSLYQSLMNKAKEEAEAKVLKIAMKDIGEDYEDKKKKAYQEAEEALYQEGERIAAYVVQEYLKNNPELGLSQVLDILGIPQDEYALQLKEYGKDIDIFVARNMKQWEAAYEAPPKGEQLRVLAEEALATSEYQKIVTAMELQTLEKLVKAQARLDKMVREKTGEATAEEAAKAIREMDDREKQKAGLRAYRDDSVGIYKQIKDYVSAKLENMTIKEANDIRKWQRLSKQALDDASNALAAGEWGKAANAKRRQLVYQEFASRAVTNGKKIAQTVDVLVKKGEASKKNKNMKAADNYLFNHMLYVFGLVKKDAVAPADYTSFSQVLANRDETLENPYVDENGQLSLPDWLIHAVAGNTVYEGGYRNMTNETFKEVADVMKVVYKMGTDANKLRYAKDIHGNKLKLDEAVRLIGAEAAKETRPIYVSDPTGLGNPSAKDKLYDSWRWCNAWLEKAETTLRKLGPSAIRFIYEPMKEAAIDELKRANELSKQIDEIFSVYSDKEKFDLKHKVVTKLGSSNVTRENLIMIALNYGTVINRKRLMDGHNISGYEIDKALAYLDERDWTLVKKVWDLYEQRWPELARIEAEASGAILKKQEAVGFNIMDKNGKVHVLQGGYFPIKYDPLKNAVVNERQADAAKMANTASSAMSLGKSMTKERVQGRVSIPLRRDFGVITESLTEQTHLIAMRLAVRDVRRIILNKEFAAIVEQHLGMSAYGALRKWSSDCWAQEPANKSPYERFAQVVRSNSTMAVLGFRTMTAVLNVLNIAPMAHYLTPAGAYAAIKSYYAHPIEQRNFIFSKSTFMAERAETIDRDIAAAIRNSGSYTTKVPGYELIQKSAFKLIAETDLMLANPLWLMEYQKVYHERLFKNGVEQKLPPEQLEREAINAADKAVRTVFGSNMKHDQAQVQRGDEWIKQLTMYYSYFSTVYNALDWAVHESRKANFYKKGVMEQIVPIANGFLFWILIPALGEALIRPIGDDDKDKYTGEKIAGKTAGAVISGLFGGIPLLREFIPHLVAPYLGEKRYDLGSMSWVAFALQVEEITDTMRKMHKGKKDGIDLARETLRLVDYATGLPFTVTDAMTTFLRYADEGFDKDITEFLRAVAFDKQLKSKKK